MSTIKNEDYSDVVEPLSHSLTKEKYQGADDPLLLETCHPCQDLINSIDTVIWETDGIDGHYLYVSTAVEQLLGFPVHMWLSQPNFWIEHLHPEDRERMSEARSWMVDTCLNNDLSRFSHEFEYRMINSAGEIVWLRERTAVMMESGLPRLRGVMMDITNTKLHEKEVMWAEQLWHQQTQREQVLYETSLRIRQFLELESVLKTTVKEVQTLLKTDRVLLYQIDPETCQGKVVVEEVSPGWSSVMAAQIHDPCFGKSNAELYRNGRIQIIPDIYEIDIPDCYFDLLDRFQVRANLVVPIIGDHDLWGLMIAHQCGGPRDWFIQDIQLMERLATQVGIAIQQAELYERVQTLNHTLEQQVKERTHQLRQSLTSAQVLQRVSEKIRSTLDEHQILQAATQELGQVLKADYCYISLYKVEARQARIECEYSPRGGHILPGQIVSIKQFPEIFERLLAGQLYHQQLVASFQNLADLDRISTSFESHLNLPLPIRPSTILVCPIVLQIGGDDDREVLGDISIFCEAYSDFGEQEIWLIKQVANQCAIAIRQARLYHAVQRQVDELEHLNHLKDDFLSTVSHELRTPMSNIKMASFMLKQCALDPRSQQYLQILESECSREITLINDLLDLQRLGSQSIKVSIQYLRLDQWVPDLASAFEVRAQERQLQLAISIDPDLPAFSSDPVLLGRALGELLNNACKYSPPLGQIDLTVKTSEANVVEFWVTNPGHIPEVEKERIFDKFYRLPNADPWQQGGTGLGLALVKKLMEHLGGTIELVPQPQQVTFRLCFPHSTQ